MRELAEHSDEELESLRFAFNDADTLAIQPDNVLLFKSKLGDVEGDSEPATA